MSAHSEKSTWLILLITCLPILAASSAVPAADETQMELMPVNATVAEPKTNSTKDLLASETADPKKVDIVKQIRRLNEDGSYTVGYEAGDGTFKIESRDVQGNIKGTFGYVDGDGEIKRVSYSTSNATQAPLLLPVIHASRFNRTVTTTRRPQPTIIYPKTSSGGPTRATVIQAIPRRRPISPASNSNAITTTESYRVVSGNQYNNSESTEAPKTLKQFPIFTARTTAETIKSVLLSEADDAKSFHQNGQQRMPMESNGTASTSNPIRSTIVYDKNSEKNKLLRPNTFRRQLNPNHYENEQMFVFQQSAGDDTTDVYGGPILSGTARPLFTTTIGKPRLVPIHSILAARQRLSEKLATNSPPVHEDQQETTLEATTNKINDGNYVTSNPIPILQISNDEQRPYIKHIPVTQFRTREFLRDNPGAPVPIGNQRLLFRYNPNIQVDDNGQFIRQQIQRPIAQNLQNENQDQDKPNLISIPVQPISVPAARYQNYNPYNQQLRIENSIPHRNEEFKPISAPVSTKDLKRLLQELLIRQNRIQTLMDIREDYRQPYNPQYVPQAQLFEPEYRQKPVYSGRSAYPQQFAETRPYNNGYNMRQIQFNPNYPYQPLYQNQQQNQFPNRNDYRQAPQQEEGYRNNEINNFDPAVPYESQRFIPKRRTYRPRVYDPRFEETNMASETNEEPIEYLPPDVRESLLLKMLMLAIHPDFNPGSIPVPIPTNPPTEFRKKVRNVQILGEESDTKEQQIPQRN